MSREVSIKVNARHIGQLGRELVTDYVTALTELVKNSYDADSQAVEVEFQDILSGQGRIVIADTGCGFTEDDIENKWAVIGTNCKVKVPYSPVYNRRCAGRKGIGRYSVERLAEHCTLYSFVEKFLSRDFKRQCAYCKIREGDLGGPDNFEKDHFIPKTKGGSDNYENLYYACSSCNGKDGKSDKWSPTLLDPCKDDIFGIHIELLSDYRFRDITPQGKEYIKTLKLNRQSYKNKREIIDTQRNELQAKLAKYKELYELALSGGIIADPEFFQDDINETEKILEQGVNYRLSENYFDEDTDELIFISLQKAGFVRCVDRDYDLFYEMEINSKKYLCNIQIDNFDFCADEKVFRYISADKIAVWKEIEKETPILIITFNQNDNNLYYTRLAAVLKKVCDYDRQKYIYYIYAEDLLENLNK